MDYMELVHEAVKFIEKHYDEELMVSDIADQVFLSPSYFSTVFKVLTGYTVKEYLNFYRLYKAAIDLKETSNSLLYITFNHGFTSQQAFTKKFVQRYGTSPARFRKLNPALEVFPPKNIFMEEGFIMELKQIFDKVQFVTKESFLVIGIETDIDYNRGTGNIGELYDRWNAENLIAAIPDQVRKNVVYGMTHESADNDTAKYMIGVEVSTLDHLPSGFIGRRFDTCDYAVFKPTLAMEQSGDFWRYFYKNWLKEQGLTQPATVYTKNKYTYTKMPNFEVYDEAFKNASSTIEIYAPILRK